MYGENGSWGPVIGLIVAKLAAAYANTVIVEVCPRTFKFVDSIGVRFLTDSVPSMFLHQENF
jgi:hypothetical protein